jgi:hypothetical protein
LNDEELIEHMQIMQTVLVDRFGEPDELTDTEVEDYTEDEEDEDEEESE